MCITEISNWLFNITLIKLSHYNAIKTINGHSHESMYAVKSFSVKVTALILTKARLLFHMEGPLDARHVEVIIPSVGKLVEDPLYYSVREVSDVVLHSFDLWRGTRFVVVIVRDEACRMRLGSHIGR